MVNFVLSPREAHSSGYCETAWRSKVSLTRMDFSGHSCLPTGPTDSSRRQSNPQARIFNTEGTARRSRNQTRADDIPPGIILDGTKCAQFANILRPSSTENTEKNLRKAQSEAFTKRISS